MLRLIVLALLGVQAILSVPLVEEQSGKFEGDILLTPNQEDFLFGGRTGVLNSNLRWTQNIVPYLLVDLTPEQAVYVRSAMDEMESQLCVTFVERTTQTNYVRVTTSDSGCYSYIGMIGQAQQLNLQSYEPGTGCFRWGTIQHEFIHALGFYHMQSATERDDYVTIVWDNIQAGTENNFATYTADRISQFGIPYDYSSVMHYSSTAFSINGEDTIIPKDPEAVIGQRNGLSPDDVRRINAMYC